MSPQAAVLCETVARLDHAHSLNPEDAEVMTVLVQGLYENATMRALLHGLAAGIQAYLIQQGQAQTRERG